MGQYLRQQYEERDLAKTLAKVHGIIDEETQKLSDKVKNLTLSHNRMRKLLEMSLRFFEDLAVSRSLTMDDAEYLHKRLVLELYGLEGYKSLYEIMQMKGGKKCG